MDEVTVFLNTLLQSSDVTGIPCFYIHDHAFDCIKVYAVRMGLNLLNYFSDHSAQLPSLPYLIFFRLWWIQKSDNESVFI